MKEKLSTAEAARRLRRSPTLVRRLADRGVLDYERCALGRLIDADSVAALVRRWETDPPRRGRPRQAAA